MFSTCDVSKLDKSNEVKFWQVWNIPFMVNTSDVLKLDKSKEDKFLQKLNI